MLDYAEQMTLDATKVTDKHFARMRKQGCSDEEILEATVVAALFNYMDRVADALEVQADPWSDSPPPCPPTK